MDLEVRFGFSLFRGFRFSERIVFAEMFAHHFIQQSLVRGLGDDTLLLQDGQDAHLLLDQLDGLFQIHAEVDKGPHNALGFVGFLLEDEHVVVEELLQTLVGVVDQKLFQSVELENLETGDIQHAWI